MKTIIIGVFLREQSALSEYFLKMADEFIKLGYHVIIITDEDRKDLVDTKSKPMILTWPSYHPNKFKDFIYIKNLIKKYRPKMLISNFAEINLFLIVGRIYGVPHRVSWLHTLSTQQIEVARWRFWRRKYVFKLGTHFIANSNATKIDYMKTYDIQENKITVLPNLINANDSYISLDSDWKIIFVGRFHESKGIDVLIEAMRIVIKDFPDIKLEIIAGGDPTYYIDLVQKYSLEKNIIFLGKQPREKVLEHLAKAQFSIVPSLAEAFGYVVIEAFSVKTPVVGSDTGGIAEIIKEDISGQLFPVGDHKKLADKIITMLSDKELREKCAEGAYISFKETYELNQNIGNAVDVFQKILKGSDVNSHE